MSGSTAWENSARARAYFHRNEDDDAVRILSRKKSNYSAIGDSHDITLLWSRGVYTLPTAPDEVDRIQHNTTKQQILNEIDAAYRRGAGYKKRGPRSAFTALVRVIDAKPNIISKIVNEAEAEGSIMYHNRNGYKVLER
jgi:hypothetical protein